MNVYSLVLNLIHSESPNQNTEQGLIYGLYQRESDAGFVPKTLS